ncbi:oxidoreductase [Niallia circulans]|uniref:flavodoxin family protein n=1 Tax=Shouchella clausii TaxID=79880 RepID=UPI000D8D12A1|nr:flavodoxin family protein [Shouchella clausii]MCM3549812.1 flavodoxin family protein [Shouchella clausii]SPU21546.1 oxidoreductase [Niallia circulans]
MKILFLNGSLRRGGSTDGVVDFARQYLEKNYPEVQVETIYLCEKEIQICDSDYYCDTGICGIQDDVRGIVNIMKKADAIVYALPVHAFGANSLMQIFLERAGVGYLRFERPLEGKLASVIVTGRRYSHELVWSQIALNIMLNKMILVGSGFPAVVKSDGKERGRTILDQEGKGAVIETCDKIASFLKFNAEVPLNMVKTNRKNS